ncbi:hypothetical protein N657DRAFT_639296 [Parathielavia appendiculata]|uniref:Uncharacterized protein n=1 Tax=Parathielavia appendiculata TaxID=2587402 RepID=A0AAN6Z7N1_9PEZI|nr:hypothetical protein N657DRAFT_639296 [Parathielavia appendiculata]
MNSARLIEILTESFIALSDEVQSLIDRKTILEHKLRYAHEQYQYLADKYAPRESEIFETLAKLQLPPDLHPAPTAATSAVPLPKRVQGGTNQHQLALLIREGRKAAHELAAGIASAKRVSEGREDNDQSTSPGMDILTSISTVLEKDFTVEGKKGVLACPFSAKPNQDGGSSGGAERVDVFQGPTGAADPTPHKSSDPICAAMLEETADPSAAVPAKCPIRFLDKHSPEEIAHYVETHKHAIPRSHEVCVRRYQRNEEQIRKLDAKYGSLVNMVKDLSQLHRPMMPPSKDEQKEANRASSQTVKDWTQTVVAGDPGVDESTVAEERETRFDRPLRDVRVGESPSRPWGISVPLEAGLQQREPSPPRPVEGLVQAQQESAAPKKCPFDHTKMFRGTATHENPAPAHLKLGQPPTPARNDLPPPSTPQPTFVNLPEGPAAAGEKNERPQVVFNISGPVFIGYPMEQAIEFMRQVQGR